MSNDTPPVPPVAHPAQVPATAWRDGRKLILLRNAPIPTDRCIQCNAPADGRPVRRKFSWYNPLWALLILASLLIFVIVALAVSKRAKVHVGVCARHRRLRKWGIFIGWMSIPTAAALFAFAISQSHYAPGIIGVVAFFAMIIVGVSMAQPVRAVKIDDWYITLKGAHPDYLEQFPPVGASVGPALPVAVPIPTARQ